MMPRIASASAPSSTNNAANSLRIPASALIARPPPAARPDGDHDEDHFQSFEDHRLEACKRGKPIEPRLMAERLVAQFCRLGCKSHRFVMERNNSSGAQDRLSQPAHAEQQEQDADR